MILIDEGDRTAVGYVCLWEGKPSGSSFLHLFNTCYHMVGRSSEVSLSKYMDITMENITDNNNTYTVAKQGIERTKTGKYQELCIYPERENFLFDWYWSMAYLCIMDTTDKEFIFPKFAKVVFKKGESTIDSKVSKLFKIIYEHFYQLVQQYRKGK